MGRHGDDGGLIRDSSVEGGFDQGLPVGIRVLVELASQPEHREARKPDRTQVAHEPDDALLVYLATGTEGRRQDRVAAAKHYAHARSFTTGSRSRPDADKGPDVRGLQLPASEREDASATSGS